MLQRLKWSLWTLPFSLRCHIRLNVLPKLNGQGIIPNDALGQGLKSISNPYVFGWELMTKANSPYSTGSLILLKKYNSWTKANYNHPSSMWITHLQMNGTQFVRPKNKLKCLWWTIGISIFFITPRSIVDLSILYWGGIRYVLLICYHIA